MVCKGPEGPEEPEAVNLKSLAVKKTPPTKNLIRKSSKVAGNRAKTVSTD